MSINVKIVEATAPTVAIQDLAPGEAGVFADNSGVVLRSSFGALLIRSDGTAPPFYVASDGMKSQVIRTNVTITAEVPCSRS